MRSIEGDPMVWPHPRDVILYARSSYYYDNMFIICLFSDILSDFKTCFGILFQKIAGTFAIRVHTTKYRQSLAPPFVGRPLG